MSISKAFYILILTISLSACAENTNNTSAREQSPKEQEAPLPAPASVKQIIEQQPAQPETSPTATPQPRVVEDQTVKKKPADKPAPQVVAKKKQKVTEERPKEAAPVKAATSPPETQKKETMPEEKVQAEQQEAPQPPSLSHDTWNQLLQKHVSATGKVDYAGFKTDQARLKDYLNTLAENPVENSWPRNKKLAYWINAYNAFTIQLILDNYPVKRITNLHGGKPWDVKWIALGGKTYSLNNIENDIIRPQFNEPRIHFAVNCAAKSCPPLLNKAYTADNINTLLDQQAKKFINNANYNTLGKTEVEVSKIFEWYGQDFGNLINYLNKYATTPIASDAKVNFKEYDWQLNN